MDYRQKILKEERIREVIIFFVRAAMFFAAALLLQFAWHLSFEPVFKLAPLTYLQSLGFIMCFRALLGFPDYSKIHFRTWMRRMQLQNHAFLRRMFMEQKQTSSKNFDKKPD